MWITLSPPYSSLINLFFGVLQLKDQQILLNLIARGAVVFTNQNELILTHTNCYVAITLLTEMVGACFHTPIIFIPYLCPSIFTLLFQSILVPTQTAV